MGGLGVVVAVVGGRGVASGKGVHKKCKLHPALPTPWCVAHNRPTAPPAVPHLPQMPRLLPVPTQAWEAHIRIRCKDKIQKSIGKGWHQAGRCV